MNDQANSEKPKRHRSPNYPYVDFRRALDLARKLHDTYKVHPASDELVAKQWDASPTSSSFKRLVATLGDFGLITTEAGSHGGRNLKVTESARRIFLNHPSKDSLLKDLALSPPIYKAIWKHYEGELPPNDILAQYLIFDLGFNEDIVRGVINNFKVTVQFANLEKSSKFEDEGVEVDNNDEIVDSENKESEPRPSRAPSSSNLESPNVLAPTKAPASLTFPPNLREVKFPLPSGDAVLLFPQGMNDEDFELLSDYLNAFKKAEQRAAAKKIAASVEKEKAEEISE